MVSTEIQKLKKSCLSFVANFTGNLSCTKELLNLRICIGIPHKIKSTSCPIFLTSIIMNAKETRFYAEGAIDFAGMCFTTYSDQSKND